jgi:hypothetical protein
LNFKNLVQTSNVTWPCEEGHLKYLRFHCVLTPSTPAASEKLNAKENTVCRFAREDAAVPAMPHLDPAAKAAAFADLRQRAMTCVKCNTWPAQGKTLSLGWEY